MDNLDPSSTDKGNKKNTSKASGKTGGTSPKKDSAFCNPSKSSSHTQFYKTPRHSDKFKKVTRDEYLSVSESISTTESFNCFHKDGRKYSPEGLLKRNFIKELDPIPIDRTWTEGCSLTWDWDLADKLVFLVTDSSVLKQLDRLKDHLRDFARLSSYGYRVDITDSLSIILHYLFELMPKVPDMKEYVVMLLKNLKKPILLTAVSDVVKHFHKIQLYIELFSYLLIIIEDDVLHDMVSEAILWHFMCPDHFRGSNAVKRCHTLAAASTLIQPFVRMLSSASVHRFPTFLQIVLVLACDSKNNCITMMKENIIENIFFRFNPYQPNQLLSCDRGPADPQDINVTLGASAINMRTTMSLLLILMKTTKEFLENNPHQRALLPCPSNSSLECFAWAYRYECLARDHGHERITLTIIAACLFKCFGVKLMRFASVFMPDIMSLSVMTEIPKRDDWIGRVNFNTLQMDVQFKKALIYLVVHMLKLFPCNAFMVESRYWLLGMMYLIDPGLCRLQADWSPGHYDELRKICLQALVSTLPICDPKLIHEYALIRRILWYIEWYTECPYNISTLYWCIRLLHVTVGHRTSAQLTTSIQTLYDTHGIIILTRLCCTLLEQKAPPVEKSQAVLAVCLRMLARAVRTDSKRQITCCVYPTIRWPQTVFPLATQMMSNILFALEKHYLVSDRWLVAFLNFTWEAIIWNNKYREKFTEKNGVYKLLDIVSVTGPSVQCIALALICDIVRSGRAVGQLVTWRAGFRASAANPTLVKRGSTIATLLAAIFRDECRDLVTLSEFDVIQDVESQPLMKKSSSSNSRDTQKSFIFHSTLLCESAFDLAGSRRSKTFALLHMLSEDLKLKVEVADEAYNMYKNIKLDVKDETILVLCSYFLTLKLNETWLEAKDDYGGLILDDQLILNDFLQISYGWNQEIKQAQEDVVARNQRTERDEENSLYSFLGRIRLNVALDALKNVRCVARSADRHHITHDLLHDAVFAHHRLSVLAKQLDAPILKTYRPPLDDANVIGQNVKVCSIHPKSSLVHIKDSSPKSVDEGGK